MPFLTACLSVRPPGRESHGFCGIFPVSSVSWHLSDSNTSFVALQECLLFTKTVNTSHLKEEVSFIFPSTFQ